MNSRQPSSKKRVHPLVLILRNRLLLREAVYSEIYQRNAGSVLGNWWLVLAPVILLTIYCVVYLFVFRVRPSDMTALDYILHIFAGLIPFLAMSEGISLGMSSLDSSRNLLKTTTFPVEILPVRSVLSTLPTAYVGMILLFVFAAAIGRLQPVALLIPVIFLLQVMFVIGIAWLLSMIVLILKDTRNLVNYLIMVGMILSPIAYSLDMLPSSLRLLIWANPFAYFILCYQVVLVEGQLPPWQLVVPAVIISQAVFYGGYRYFSRLKAIIANYA